ncbi:hypothetical protein ENUP19_0042G0054 [Entamoeba nuttalli]|uniref:Uncharacterized protein n=1 Tax=Entamoeba nuttalli TaxID=412467 RepID=A0ABQ0DAC9_9EUKA
MRIISKCKNDEFEYYLNENESIYQESERKSNYCTSCINRYRIYEFVELSHTLCEHTSFGYCLMCNSPYHLSSNEEEHAFVCLKCNKTCSICTNEYYYVNSA